MTRNWGTTPFIEAARTLRMDQDFRFLKKFMIYYLYNASGKVLCFCMKHQQHPLEEWWKIIIHSIHVTSLWLMFMVNVGTYTLQGCYGSCCSTFAFPKQTKSWCPSLTYTLLDSADWCADSTYTCFGDGFWCLSIMQFSMGTRRVFKKYWKTNMALENPPFEAVFASKPCGFSNVMLVFRGVYMSW